MSSVKYIGMDVHAATIIICVLNANGRLLKEDIIATGAEAILNFVASQRGSLHVTFEEGEQAAWLYDLLGDRVERVIVCDARRNAALRQSGHKDDRSDARHLAEWLRTGNLTAVYHGERSLRTLQELKRVYTTLVEDCVRTMNRLKSLFRGRGIACSGRSVYRPSQRTEWLQRLPDDGVRQHADLLYQELETQQQLRRRARHDLLAESRRRPAQRILLRIPGWGPLRVALLMAIVQTPYRFRSKRQLWTYACLALVTAATGEYLLQQGRVVRARRPAQVRGLNPNGHRELKALFKGAVFTACHRDPVWQELWASRVARGQKPQNVHLTLSRKMAALVLHLWKKGETYDARQLKAQAV